MNSRILFATDLDGTLLDRHCLVPPEYAARLRKLIENGALFTVATGRHPRSAAEALKGSGLLLSTPAICLNGSVLWDMNEDKPARAWPIGAEPLKKVWDTVMDFSVAPHFQACDMNKGTLTTYYIPALDPDGSARPLVYEPSSEPPCIFAPAGDSPDPNTVSLSYFAPREALEPIRLRCMGIEGVRTVFYASTRFSNMYFLELYARGGGKGCAAKEAMKFCGADRLFVFGDSENDADMFKEADRSFAPANAAPAILRTADETVPSNLDGGVVSTIERYFTVPAADNIK
ncbi:MAG: HAD family hydrolase [Clostridiales bacterium]|nr:HAD family hydrolase [Clostridiales bacterium]